MMKDERARPATLEDVKQLISALNEAGAEYILIGGYALYAHGYRRATEDIDILIPKNRHAGEIVKCVFRSELSTVPAACFHLVRSVRSNSQTPGLDVSVNFKIT